MVACLNDSFSSKVMLNGIIYLHRISDRKFPNSAHRYNSIFKFLCRDDPIKNVVIATTMWDVTPPEEAQERDQQLMSNEKSFGYMISKGSTPRRHYNTVETARSITRQRAGQELNRGTEKERAQIAAQLKLIDKHDKDMAEVHAAISQEKLHQERLERLERRQQQQSDMHPQEMRKRDEATRALEKEKTRLEREAEQLALEEERERRERKKKEKEGLLRQEKRLRREIKEEHQQLQL
ncbi:hypothetical protein F4778DRAFT_792718 [Xylariomycetidae sp. FL2044]|nr:hypothetical protein F4778DRAFT_792718 [Xylariomycetidae sp. FL2044]